MIPPAGTGPAARYSRNKAALRTPAAERRRRKLGVGTKCLAIGEFAHERLPDQNGGALHTDSA